MSGTCLTTSRVIIHYHGADSDTIGLFKRLANIRLMHQQQQQKQHLQVLIKFTKRSLKSQTEIL